MPNARKPTERFFALLLRAYPRPFRAAFGPEMIAFFREDRARAARAGLAARFGFWWRTLADLTRSAGTQRLAVVRPPRRRHPAPRKAGTMSSLLFDLRYALRSLARSPVFLVVAIATLLLGIGATTAILSVVDGVLVRGLPYPDAERLVLVGSVLPNDPEGLGPLSLGALRDLMTRTSTLEAVVGSNARSMTLRGDGEPQLVATAMVSRGFFEIFGVPMGSGRGLAGDDFSVGARRVAVLAHGFWQQRWGGDPDVVGQTITLNDETFTIVGVAATGFHRPQAVSGQAEAQLWIPWQVDWEGGALDYRSFGYQGVGKLAAGATVDGASAEVDALLRGASRERDFSSEVGARVASLRAETLGDIGRPLRLLMLAGAFLLLISCVNVAHLLLARHTARSREISLHSALGAARGRIVRQLLIESVLLALIAGLLGAGFAQGAITAIKALDPGGIPRLDEVAIDLRVLSVALLVSTLTGVLFGLAPVAHLGRAVARADLRAAATARAGGGKSRARDALVVAEVALALVLLVGAGLLMRSLFRLTRVDIGFEPAGLVSMRVNLRSGYPAESWSPFFDELIERVAALPGVTSASLTTSLPFVGTGMITSQLAADGASEDPEYTTITYISGGHFRNMRMRLLEGRDFGATDTASGPAVAIVNEAYRDQYWPGADTVLGRSITLDPGGRGAESIVVVGLANDLRYAQGRDPIPEIYLPVTQRPWRAMTVVARTDGSPASLVPGMRRAVWAIDPDLPIDRVATVPALARDAMTQPRFYSLLAASLAIVALLLALIGIYGTISYAVGCRLRELGIRMALGAQRWSVIGLVVGGGMRLTAIGVLLGGGAAWGLSRLLSSFLFDVTPTDLATFVGAPLLFVATAVVACYLPARRAARLDPTTSLRADV